MPKIPSYRLHKASGQAVVWLGGRDVYLGEHGSPESQEQYHRLISEWLANGRRPTIEAHPDLTVVELCAAYWRHAQRHYRRPDGTPTDTIHRVRQAIKAMKRMYGSVPVQKFGPKALQALQHGWAQAGLSRTTVNQYTSQAKQIFKWGLAQELVPETIYRALAAVAGLRAGRTEARETEPKTPVPHEHINAVRPHVIRQVWALIQLEMLTGARGGELVRLRPIDFDTSGPVWTATLSDHKTTHRGREKVIYCGPRGQAIVRQFMADRPVNAFLFSPKDAARERASAAPTHRRSGQPAPRRKTNRVLRDRYTSRSYHRAVTRACKAAGVPHWHPHRLRHNAATRFRRESGIEAARVILGHASGDMTELYAERDRAVAVGCIGKVG